MKCSEMENVHYLITEFVDTRRQSSINGTVAPAQQASSGTKEMVISCGDCSKLFITRRNYNRHRKTHDRPHHCALCLQKFALRTDLDRHGAQHAPASVKFHCAWPQCKFQGSVRKDYLLKHMNEKHMDQDGMEVNSEEWKIHKKKLLGLYKKATGNEKLLKEQRMRKLAVLEAVASEDEPTVRQLLENWAGTQTSDSLETSLLSEALLRATQHGNENVIPLLLETGAAVNVKDKHGLTLLSLAAKNGHKDILEQLLGHRLEVNHRDRHGRTPLSHAAENGHAAVVKHLLEHGAKVDSRDFQDKTPLSYATSNGHEAVVKYLLEYGAEVDSRDLQGRTPLSWAAENGHAALVKHLLEHGAKVDSRDLQGRTPLSWAAENGHAAVVKHLQEHRAEADSRDFCGRTPLSYATSNGHEAVVKYLLEHRAEADSRDFCRTTPLFWAAGNGHEAVVQQLLEAGADVRIIHFSGRDLLYSAMPWNEDMKSLLREHAARIEHRFDPDC